MPRFGVFLRVLRFIPYVGSFAAAIMPSALSLVVFEGWLWPILVVGIFVAFELGCVIWFWSLYSMLKAQAFQEWDFSSQLLFGHGFGVR